MPPCPTLLLQAKYVSPTMLHCDQPLMMDAKNSITKEYESGTSSYFNVGLTLSTNGGKTDVATEAPKGFPSKGQSQAPVPLLPRLAPVPSNLSCVRARVGWGNACQFHVIRFAARGDDRAHAKASGKKIRNGALSRDGLYLRGF